MVTTHTTGDLDVRDLHRRGITDFPRLYSQRDQGRGELGERETEWVKWGRE